MKHTDREQARQTFVSAVLLWGNLALYRHHLLITVKLLAPCKWTQHCWPTELLGINCCVRVHVALGVNYGVSKAYTAIFRRTLNAKAQ